MSLLSSLLLVFIVEFLVIIIYYFVSSLSGNSCSTTTRTAGILSLHDEQYRRYRSPGSQSRQCYRCRQERGQLRQTFWLWRRWRWCWFCTHWPCVKTWLNFSMFNRVLWCRLQILFLYLKYDTFITFEIYRYTMTHMYMKNRYLIRF